MTKEDIQNRIEQVAYDGATGGCNQAVIEREAEKLATELVKLFATPVVSQCCLDPHNRKMKNSENGIYWYCCKCHKEISNCVQRISI